MIDAPRQTAAPGSLGRLQRLVASARPLLGAARIETLGKPGRCSLILCCLALAGLALGPHPGQILADTKIDLALNPAGFLQRALQLWDPAQFGQLQNQAAGYFFPIGPFFLLGKLASVPGWITQRLWITAVLLVAFTGVIRLCRVLGIGTQASQLVAGLSYALSPMALSLLGYDSAQVLPAAMLPWILVPLVLAVRAGPDATAGRRARLAAQSALAVALCSGVNAAATAAVLVPAVIYLLAAPRPAPRWRIMSWWVAAVLLASAWWLYPLLLFGRYGVSFLPYTESAATTTSVTSLFNSLRGTEDWLAHLVSDERPWLPDGFRIATQALPTILTGLVAGLGLTGLVSRRTPHRRFLLWMLLAGVFIVVTGYVSALGNPLAPHIDSLINGPLAPLRNFDKFDPLIRLPISLGLASRLGHARSAWPARLTSRVPLLSRRAASPADNARDPRGAILAAVAVGAVGLVALPIYVSGLSVPGSFDRVPGFWTSAAAWLNRHAGHSAVLEEPGARFGQYTWGSPLDDVLEPLFVGDWASSQLGVIGSVGNTRLLEAIDQQMSAGAGSAGLTELLGRMGVRYLVVRNDLLRADLRQAWPARIHDAITQSPGIVKVAQFGSPPVARQATASAVTGVDPPYPPVQIYQVEGAQPAVTVQPTAGTVRVFGAPEGLLTLANLDMLAGRPALLNADAPQVRASATVVTDSLRRRVRNFGEIRDGYSPTLTAAKRLATFEAAADFTEPGWSAYEAVARYTGIESVTASSSEADIDDAVPNQAGTGFLPFAAVDGNLKTMWESGSRYGPVGQWVQITFDTTIDPGRVRVAFADNRAVGPPVRRVEITTSAGRSTEPVRGTSGYQVLRLPRGPTSFLRLRVTGVGRSPRVRGSQVAIEEISVPGVHAGRTIEAPPVRLPGGGDPTAVVLAKAEPQPSGCMLTPARWVCSPTLETSTEEQYGFDESFWLPHASVATLSGTAIMTDQELIERSAYAGPRQPVVTASSALTADPEDQANSAFDGDPQTSWIAAASDPRPTLTIRWHGSVTVGSIVVVRPPGASGLAQVTIKGSGGQVRGVVLGGPGDESTEELRFAPMATDILTMSFSSPSRPVQVTDVEIPGVLQLTADRSAPVSIGCGHGPVLDVDGKAVPTRAAGTVADLLTGRPLAVTACSRVPVGAGPASIVEPSDDAFSVQAVTIDTQAARLAAAPAAPSEAVRTMSWTQARRVLRVAAGQQSYLVVNQNYNAGWQAVLDGHRLQPVQLDGWKQGWLLPARSRGLVTLSYEPEGPYRAALIGGLAMLCLVAGVALIPVRRRHRAARPDQTRAESAGPAGPPGSHELLGVAGLPTTPLRVTARLAVWLCLTSVAGLWMGGYPGAVGLPIVTAGFGVALAYRTRYRWARALVEPWVAMAFVVLAAASAVLGEQVAGDAALTGPVPQLACLFVVARLAAALYPEVPGDLGLL